MALLDRLKKKWKFNKIAKCDKNYIKSRKSVRYSSILEENMCFLI